MIKKKGWIVLLISLFAFISLNGSATPLYPEYVVQADGTELIPGHSGPDYIFSGTYENGHIIISGAGSYVLSDNLAYSGSDAAIIINGSDIHLNGNEHELSGNDGTGIVSNSHAAYARVENFTSISGFETGMILYGNYCDVIKNNVSFNSGNGVYVNGNNNTISNNIIKGNTYSGINTTSIHHIFSDNLIADNGRNGINSQDFVEITGNEIFGNGRDGVLVWNNATVSDNIISHNIRYGIKATNYVDFFSNLVESNGNDGISTGRFSTIHGNTVLNNKGSGIFTGHTTTLADNVVSGNQKYGIWLGNMVSVKNCTIYNNQYGGLIAGNNADVRDNNVFENQGIGIDLSNFVTIINNSVSNNLYSGIFTLRSSEIHNNTITHNGDCGINGWGNSNISKNFIDDNWIGIYLPDNSVNIHVNQNQILSSGDCGIFIDSGGWDEGSGFIYDNYLGNLVNIGGSGTLSYYGWTNPKGPEPGLNIINGPNIAGNYWSNLTRSGWSDLQEPIKEGYSSTSYELIPSSGVYDIAPLVRSIYDISASGDAWTYPSPSGEVLAPRFSNATFLNFAKPGAELENITVDHDWKGPILNWTFFDVDGNHEIQTIGSPIPGQIHTRFDMFPKNGNPPQKVQFIDLSVGDPTSWYWQFGDGESSTEKDPVHQYTNPGTFTVSLRAYNDGTGGYSVCNNCITVQ